METYRDLQHQLLHEVITSAEFSETEKFCPLTESIGYRMMHKYGAEWTTENIRLALTDYVRRIAQRIISPNDIFGDSLPPSHSEQEIEFAKAWLNTHPE